MNKMNDMKKIMFAALAAAVLCGCAKEGIKYRVTGTVPNLSGEIALVTNDTVLGRQTVKNGKVDFSGTVAWPQLAFLQDAEGEYVASMFLEDGTVTLSDTEPVGTPSNDASKRYMTQIGELVNEYYDSQTTAERRVELQSREAFLMDSTIEANTDNIFGAVLLVQAVSGGGMSSAEAGEMLSKFSEPVKSHPYLVEMKGYLENMGRTDVGQQFIDIAMNDTEGKTVSLSDAVAANEYTLLDFWASWCGPCMGEVPNLKAAYEKYSDKGFEIYGVSLDEDESSWRAALKNKNMDWVNVSSLEGWLTPAVKEYRVQSIPASWLIARDGTIVARNLRGEELETKLAELLK